MYLKNHLLHWQNLFGVETNWRVRAQHWRRRLSRADERLRDEYFQTVAEPKLQVGGGWHRLEGWLNADIDLIPGVMLMDATKEFPFASESMQFVYSEHMIEHISFEQGALMLKECYRVLRKGGAIRVTTPDLAALVSLYQPALSDLQRRYLSWFCETFVPNQGPPEAVAALNAHFRLWGHQFLYDEATLTKALHTAGFHSVQRKQLRDSEHAALRDLENTARYPEGLLEYESVALEARKA